MTSEDKIRTTGSVPHSHGVAALGTIVRLSVHVCLSSALLIGCSSPGEEQPIEEWTPASSETSSASTWNPDTQVSGDGNFISAPSQLPAGCLADTELGTKVSVMADTEVVMFGPALKLESAQDVFAMKIDGPSFDATVAVFRTANSNGQEEFFALNEPARLHWPEMKKADGDLSVTRCAEGD